MTTKVNSPGNQGHVYILTSPNCNFVKIGGTDYVPGKRINEINTVEPYKSLGPWTLHDYSHVKDWRKVEYSLHYRFRDALVQSVEGQKELYSVSADEVSRALESIDEEQLIGKPKIDRLFQDRNLSDYLELLFRHTGLLNWFALQGAWTMSLFPGTGRGRYFTINIGPHEVAFSTVAKGEQASIHMIHMDRLILDFDEVKEWVENRNGSLEEDNYSTCLYRSTSVFFFGDFDDAKEFLNLPGVRRATIAYWTEALIQLQDKRSMSRFANSHDGNAVCELRRRMQAKGVG